MESVETEYEQFTVGGGYEDDRGQQQIHQVMPTVLHCIVCRVGMRVNECHAVL